MQAKILIARVSISATNLLSKSLSKLRLPFGLNFLGAVKGFQNPRFFDEHALRDGDAAQISNLKNELKIKNERKKSSGEN